MWKYIVVNALWFSILFFVHFVGTPKDRKIIFSAVFILALYLAFKTSIDPFVWTYYFAFSLLVFYGAYRFKQWAFARSIILEEEIDLVSGEFRRVRQRLSETVLETQNLEKRAGEISGLYDKIKEMSRSLDPLEVFLIFGEALSEYFEFDVMKLVFFEEDNPGMILSDEVYEIGSKDFLGLFDRNNILKNRAQIRGTLHPMDTKIFNHVFKTQTPLLPEELRDILRWPLMQNQSVTAYPILVHKKIFGIVVLTGLSAHNPRLLRILIERFVSEMERVRLYEKVETLAITDGLTGVSVRRHLMERLVGELDRSNRFGYKLSFLMIDIDHFKTINDSYGHLVGDAVIKQVAETIRANVREVDLVGRYGGEEFGVLLIETDESLALMVAERIRRSVDEKLFKVYDEKLKVTLSIGCSTYSYYELTDAPLIVESADSALYQAKRLGRNRVCLYNLPKA